MSSSLMGYQRIHGNSASGCQECTRVVEAHQQSPACQTEINASMARDQISKWWMCRTAQRLTAAQNPPVSSLQGWYSFMSSNQNLSLMLYAAILVPLFIGWKTTFALTKVLSDSNTYSILPSKKLQANLKAAWLISMCIDDKQRDIQAMVVKKNNDLTSFSFILISRI